MDTHEINVKILDAMRHIMLAAQEDSITLTQLAHLADAQGNLKQIIKELAICEQG